MNLCTSTYNIRPLSRQQCTLDWNCFCDVTPMCDEPVVVRANVTRVLLYIKYRQRIDESETRNAFFCFRSTYFSPIARFWRVRCTKCPTLMGYLICQIGHLGQYEMNPPFGLVHFAHWFKCERWSNSEWSHRVPPIVRVHWTSFPIPLFYQLSHFIYLGNTILLHSYLTRPIEWKSIVCVYVCVWIGNEWTTMQS